MYIYAAFTLSKIYQTVTDLQRPHIRAELSWTNANTFKESVLSYPTLLKLDCLPDKRVALFVGPDPYEHFMIKSVASWQ